MYFPESPTWIAHSQLLFIYVYSMPMMRFWRKKKNVHTLHSDDYLMQPPPHLCVYTKQQRIGIRLFSDVKSDVTCWLFLFLDIHVASHFHRNENCNSDAASPVVCYINLKNSLVFILVQTTWISFWPKWHHFEDTIGQQRCAAHCAGYLLLLTMRHLDNLSRLVNRVTHTLNSKLTMIASWREFF